MTSHPHPHPHPTRTRTDGSNGGGGGGGDMGEVWFPCPELSRLLAALAYVVLPPPLASWPPPGPQGDKAATIICPCRAKPRRARQELSAAMIALARGAPQVRGKG